MARSTGRSVGSSDRNNFLLFLIDVLRSSASFGTLAGGGFVFLLAFIFLKPFHIVQAGERGVVMKFGNVQDHILDEGMHFKAPIVTSVKTLSVRVNKNEISAAASSKDLQTLTAEIAVNWHIDPTRVNTVYQQIGDEDQIISRILNPAVSEVVKAATAKMNAEQIIRQRTALKEEIDTALSDRLQAYGLLVDDVSLVNFSFSPEFSRSIEAKQIAEQEAKQAEYTALKAEQDAQAEINRAKGKAEAQRLQDKTLTPNVLQQQAIEKWDGQFPQVMTGGETIPMLQILQGENSQ
ncbi:MAG: prohibitin family protein [Phormidesmis sp.]